MTKSVPKPKYSIGDTVYYIVSEKIASAEITGIIKCHSESTSHITGKKTQNFSHYKYSVDFHDYGPKSYGWSKESSLFPTREELIKSL